mmetsp:Transcript_19575/g.50562  ORF Transcript_19575/g.50562 Transcript_19575/m.50562 type:complete len:252 (+) Transcript_19575:47-802(+)
MPSTAAELNKLKVADLKELLKARDLPMTGKKDELVQRLLEAEGGVAAPPQPAEPAASAAKPAEEAPPPQPSVPAPEPVAEAPAKPATDPTPAAPAQKPVAAPKTSQATAAAAEAGPAGAGAPASQELTEEERRKQRAARFGVPLVQHAPKGAADPKVEERRKRFGVVEPEAGGGRGGKKQLSAEELEKIKKRQERFGVVSGDPGSGGDGGKKRQKTGAGDGGEAKPAVEMSAEMKQKLEERAKRFGAPPQA